MFWTAGWDSRLRWQAGTAGCDGRPRRKLRTAEWDGRMNNRLGLQVWTAGLDYLSVSVSLFLLVCLCVFACIWLF